MTPAESITWPQLAAFMAAGESLEPTLSGVVRVVDVERADDDESADVEVDGARYRHVESRYRVARRGDLVRRERLADGRPLSVLGERTVWSWEDGDDVPTAYPRDGAFFGFTDDVLLRRPDWADHRRGDYTDAAGAPVARRFLGRDAWQVELVPPAHKPFPLTQVVDAVTGMVLSRRNDGFGTLAEWEELTVGADLPDGLFVWDGPVREPPDHEAMIREERERSRVWLSDHGIGTLLLPAAVDLSPDGPAEDGTVELHVHRTSGTLQRRPRSDRPWDGHWSWPVVHAWTDGPWDWRFGTADPLDDAARAALEAQLRGTR